MITELKDKRMIEVGKPLIITPQVKKSVTEVEMFTHPEKERRGLNTETLWRSATFLVIPKDEMECILLGSCIEHDEEFCTDNFEEWEMLDCWDGCMEEFVFYYGWSDEDKEAFQKEYEESDMSMYEFAAEHKGYVGQECIYYIENGINVEEHEGA
jgi:hypothetical protein